MVVAKKKKKKANPFGKFTLKRSGRGKIPADEITLYCVGAAGEEEERVNIINKGYKLRINVGEDQWDEYL